jgi:hypothetical protein
VDSDTQTLQQQKELGKEIFRLLSDASTFATTALVICLKNFGTDTFTMDPLELIAELEDRFKVELNNDVAEKLQAITLAVSTDAFYEDPVAFRAICNTLLNGEPGFDGFDNVTILEMVWSIYEVDILHGGAEFSSKVISMIQHEVDNDGEDIDDIEMAMSGDYVTRAIQELRWDLLEELAIYGVDESDLPPFSKEGILMRVNRSGPYAPRPMAPVA